MPKIHTLDLTLQALSSSVSITITAYLPLVRVEILQQLRGFHCRTVQTWRSQCLTNLLIGLYTALPQAHQAQASLLSQNNPLGCSRVFA